jgi:hypothetical protein
MIKGYLLFFKSVERKWNESLTISYSTNPNKSFIEIKIYKDVSAQSLKNNHTGLKRRKRIRTSATRRWPDGL